MTLRAALPKHAFLVGQNIRKDTEWLELEEGVDFAGAIVTRAIVPIVSMAIVRIAIVSRAKVRAVVSLATVRCRSLPSYHPSQAASTWRG